MLLAEVSLMVPVGIASFLGCLAFSVKLWNEMHKALDRNKEVPTPSQTYATKPELAKVEQALKQELRAVDDSVEHLRTETKEDIGEVTQNVDQLRRDIVSNGETRRQSIEGKVEKSRLEAKEDTGKVHLRIDKMQSEVDAKFEDLPSRIIAMLKNTGVIK